MCFLFTGGALTVTHDAGSVAVEAGYAYRIKRVVFDDAVFEGDIVTPDRLRVYTSMYNTDVSYLLAEEAQILVDEAGQRITVEFPSPIFTRFVKLHVTIHEMDTDGNTIGGASVLSIDPASITMTALSGGRNELYGYEPDGDRSNLSILAAAPTSTPYDYYPDSDLVRIAGGTAYRYDENGNLIEKGSEYVETGDEVEIEESGEYRRYEYDLLNRLVAVYVYDEITDDVSLLVEYGYDVNDLRIYRNGSDGISRYVFDVDGNRIEEQRSAGTDYYVFRNGRYLARRSDGGDIVYYGTDQVGTTVLLTDASGDVVWIGEATPFGDQVAESGPAEGSEALRYQGKDYDPDTGLVYFNARWYDPELGRFITEDPARDGENWYVFVGNNPLSFVDPSGLDVWELDAGGTSDAPKLGDGALILDVGEYTGYAADTSWEQQRQARDPLSWAYFGAQGLFYEIADAIIPDDVDQLREQLFVADFLRPIMPLAEGVGHQIGAFFGRLFKRGSSMADDAAKAAAELADDVAGKVITPRGPDFIVDPSGQVFPVPKGATGPTSVVNPAGNTTGNAFTGGAGGANGQVATMRIMDPRAAIGNAPAYPNGYVTYSVTVNSSPPVFTSI